jgi:AcrR family transcriptional regulator
MATSAGDPKEGRRKAGRPPRISRAMVAEAAGELGLEGLTLKAVADHLGVSVAALYHHVSGKDDLMRLAAEHSARAIPLPVDRGQNWAQWLLDWANYNLAVFTAEPGLLGQYLEGGVGPATVATNLDSILSVLVREGFSVTAANTAYGLVSSCVLGMIVGMRWEQAVATTDGSLDSAFRRIVDAAPKRDLMYVRRLLRNRSGWRPSFAERIEVVLRGIAIENSRPWPPVHHPDPLDDPGVGMAVFERR